MEGVAAGYAVARAQELFLKMRDVWIFHCDERGEKSDAEGAQSNHLSVVFLSVCRSWYDQN